MSMPMMATRLGPGIRRAHDPWATPVMSAIFPSFAIGCVSWWSTQAGPSQASWPLPVLKRRPPHRSRVSIALESTPCAVVVTTDRRVGMPSIRGLTRLTRHWDVPPVTAWAGRSRLQAARRARRRRPAPTQHPRTRSRRSSCHRPRGLPGWWPRQPTPPHHVAAGELVEEGMEPTCSVLVALR